MGFVIGIAGGTGAGKTTIARTVANALAAEQVCCIEHDAYYRDRSKLPPEERDCINFDHPDALETELLVHHLTELRAGRQVAQPVYDFATHCRSAESRTLTPAPVIVVEGILVLASSDLRDQLDLKVYVDTDSDIRVLRRVHRDMRERGRSFESVKDQYHATVRPMHLQFVEPSKRWADVIIPEGGSTVALDLLVTKVRSLAPPPRP